MPESVRCTNVAILVSLARVKKVGAFLMDGQKVASHMASMGTSGQAAMVVVVGPVVAHVELKAGSQRSAVVSSTFAAGLSASLPRRSP
ncbi:MAG: hypothetical protein IPL41_03410 [Micropruina sp.]|nr:hypothetical protein [Micropruina sp.]